MTTDRGDLHANERDTRRWRAYALLFDNPACALVLATTAIGWLAWWVFFHFSSRIWASQVPVDLTTVTRWALSAFSPSDGDGAEPLALLALVVLTSALASIIAHWLLRADRRLRTAVSVASLLGVVQLVRTAHFMLPMALVGLSPKLNAAIVVAALGLSLIISWRARAGRPLSLGAALLLVPIAFVPCASPSPGDAQAILAPSLRLLHGVAPNHIYMQYDYLLSLITQACLWLGAEASSIFLVAAVAFYALLLGLLILARRLFAHGALVGPLLVSVIIVRVYGVMGDITAIPQVSPLRLDLWILPVAVALRVGLRHWLVAATLGLLCIFSSSIGVLFLGGYGLALAADFLGERLAAAPAKRTPARRELVQFLRQLAPSIAILLGSIAIATLVLGSPISSAALLYRKLGAGQLKITAESFYWWLLPLTALTGALAFAHRAELGARRGGAALLTVGLTISSSIHFFGRSHENNLVNLAVPFLLCFFLALDIGLSQLQSARRSIVAMALSSALVALCAWQYSGDIATKLATQVSVMSRGSQMTGVLNLGSPKFFCEEVAQRVPDRKVYFFATLDAWYYERCGYAPPSYEQPVGLSILKAPLLSEINGLLADGYTIVIPKSDVMVDCFFSDFAPDLSRTSPLANTASAHFDLVQRGQPGTVSDSGVPHTRKPRRPKATP